MWRCLELFERAVAATGNPAATLTQIGDYHQVELVGGPVSVRPGRATLRLDPSAVDSVMILRHDTADDQSHPPALYVLDAFGAPVHHCHPLSPMDRLVLDGLARGVDHHDDGVASDDPPVTPALSEVDQLARLDALVIDGPARRTQEATGLPRREVDPAALPDWLGLLVDAAVPLSIGVLGDGSLQLATGVLLQVHHDPPRLLATLEHAALDLELELLHEVHVSVVHAPHGPTAMVEITCGGSPAVVLTQIGGVGHEIHARWETLVAALV